ncbi:hypothetical protein JZY06_09280, partial [Corynebacterium sp. CCM 8862]|nr:hypothetical protein [Corynebacterium mendelii]
MTKKISRPRVLIVGLIVAVAVVAVVLFATQPWRMFTSSTIDEALPGTAVTTGAAPATAAAQTAQADAPAKTQQSPAQPVPAESAPVHLKQGSFSGIDHDTSGSAYLTELPDGRRIIRLENLATDDGPD